jgi:hypothetical protein
MSAARTIEDDMVNRRISKVIKTQLDLKKYRELKTDSGSYMACLLNFIRDEWMLRNFSVSMRPQK